MQGNTTVSGIEINIDPDAVERAVVQAIVNSALGARIEKQVASALSDISLSRAIEAQVNTVIAEIIRGKLYDSEALKIKVEERLKALLTDDTLDAAINSIIRLKYARERARSCRQGGKKE